MLTSINLQPYFTKWRPDNVKRQMPWAITVYSQPHISHYSYCLIAGNTMFMLWCSSFLNHFHCYHRNYVIIIVISLITCIISFSSSSDLQPKSSTHISASISSSVIYATRDPESILDQSYFRYGFWCGIYGIQPRPQNTYLRLTSQRLWHQTLFTLFTHIIIMQSAHNLRYFHYLFDSFDR